VVRSKLSSSFSAQFLASNFFFPFKDRPLAALPSPSILESDSPLLLSSSTSSRDKQVEGLFGSFLYSPPCRRRLTPLFSDGDYFFCRLSLPPASFSEYSLQPLLDGVPLRLTGSEDVSLT